MSDQRCACSTGGASVRGMYARAASSLPRGCESELRPALETPPREGAREHAVQYRGAGERRRRFPRRSRRRRP